MKKYLLYNHLANNGNCLAKAEELKAAIGDCELKDVVGLDMHGFIASLAEDDEIHLCGGDGTVNHFANDVADIDLKQNVYLYEGGTGNDFMNDVKDKVENGRLLLNPYLKNLPKVFVNGIEKRFINGIGYGLDGMCCQVADDQIAKGKKKINYTNIAVKLLLIDYKPKKATVTVDGVTKIHEYVWILPTMKGRYYGGGMMIAPDQDRLDPSGKVTVVVFKNKGRLKVLMNFSKVFTGEHVKLTDMIEIVTGNEVTVEYDEPTALQIDGETVRNVKKYTVTTKA
ncbi:MAG: diacylglycerol kinase family protein [Clostridia bacterium]|nr:diacylglycerol kinase family protein [Clostridia bacterium]